MYPESGFGFAASSHLRIHLYSFEIMSMTRRDFIAAGSALPVAAVSGMAAAQVQEGAKTKVNPIAVQAKKPTPQIPPLVEIPGPPCLIAGPMLGHVGAETAWIWVRASKATHWKVEVSESIDFAGKRELDGGAIEADSAFTAGVCVEGLKPLTRYFYRVFFDGREVSALPEASFVTSLPQGGRGKVRIAFSSCVGRLPAHSAAAFGEMAANADFDLLLMLGDNHYADSTDLERLRLYYTAHRQLAGFRELTAKCPVYAIWDDHDFGPNDSDSTAQGKEQSLQAFREFWRNPSRGEHPEDPAIYYSFERGGVEFFMLDVRWHRSPNKQPDGPDKTMLGATQLAWLKQKLKSSKAAVKVLASGSEWQSTGHKDSWTSFKNEREPFFDWLEAEKIEGVVFVSGDRHFAAGYHIRSRWPEFTAGPLGSPNERNAKAAVSAETFTLRYDGKMWMVLEVDTTQQPAKVSYEIWEAGEGLIESQVLPPEMVKGETFAMERSALVREILATRDQG